MLWAISSGEYTACANDRNFLSMSSAPVAVGVLVHQALRPLDRPHRPRLAMLPHLRVVVSDLAEPHESRRSPVQPQVVDVVPVARPRQGTTGAPSFATFLQGSRSSRRTRRRAPRRRRRRGPTCRRRTCREESAASLRPVRRSGLLVAREGSTSGNRCVPEMIVSRSLERKAMGARIGSSADLNGSKRGSPSIISRAWRPLSSAWCVYSFSMSTHSVT